MSHARSKPKAPRLPKTTRNFGNLRFINSSSLLWGGFGIDNFYAPIVQMAAPALVPERSKRERTVLAPPTLDLWCRPPHPHSVWLEPAVLQTAYGATLYLYVGGCRGLLGLARQLGGSMFKVGVTLSALPDARMDSLTKSRYGSRFRYEDCWSSEQKGFDNWKEEAISLDVAPSPASPVSILPTALLVRLPLSLSPKAFDDALNERLKGVSLDRWVRKDAVRHELASHGIHPNLGIRGKHVAKGMVEEVSEIFFFRKKADFAALVAIAEDIVLTAVRKEVPGRSPRSKKIPSF